MHKYNSKLTKARPPQAAPFASRDKQPINESLETTKKLRHRQRGVTFGMRKIHPTSERHYFPADASIILRDEPDEDEDEGEDNGGDEEDDEGNNDGYSE
jgi:hypothetical protein